MPLTTFGHVQQEYGVILESSQRGQRRPRRRFSGLASVTCGICVRSTQPRFRGRKSNEMLLWTLDEGMDDCNASQSIEIKRRCHRRAGGNLLQAFALFGALTKNPRDPLLPGSKASHKLIIRMRV